MSALDKATADGSSEDVGQLDQLALSAEEDLDDIKYSKYDFYKKRMGSVEIVRDDELQKIWFPIEDKVGTPGPLSDPCLTKARL